MKKEDLFILLLALFILCAMIITYFLGGEGSRHGVVLSPTTFAEKKYTIESPRLHLGQSSYSIVS